MAEKTCDHEGCTCEAREDGYCSDYCALHARDEGEGALECHCGHVSCEAEPAGAVS